MPTIETIGTDCLDIIFDYKNGMEHSQKMKLCFAEIRQISHSYEYDAELNCDISKRLTNGKKCYYFRHFKPFEWGQHCLFYEFECRTYVDDSIFVKYKCIDNNMYWFKYNNNRLIKYRINWEATQSLTVHTIGEYVKVRYTNNFTTPREYHF